jgi:hypothetical protein
MDEQPSPPTPPGAPLPSTASESAAAAAPLTEVVVTDTAAAAAPRRRTGLIVAAVAVVLAAVGAGAFFLLRPSGPEFSLTEAASRGPDPMGVSFTSTSSVMGQEIIASAQGTPDATFLRMKMDLGSTMAQLGITEPIDAIVDVEQRVLYIGSSFFVALGAPVDKPWIMIDRDAAEAAGEDVSFFDQLQVDDPTDTTALFAKATDVTTVGDEEIDGEKVRHYRVAIAFADVLATNASLADAIGQLDAEVPDTIEYDVWVTKENRFRKLSYDLDLGVSSIGTTIEFERLTEPVTITLPADDEIIDALDLG